MATDIPAFPSRQPNEHLTFPDTYHYGMSLRDYFAGQFVVGMAASPELMQVVTSREDLLTDDHAARMAATAYQWADAMLKAREA